MPFSKSKRCSHCDRSPNKNCYHRNFSRISTIDSIGISFFFNMSTVGSAEKIGVGIGVVDGMLDGVVDGNALLTLESSIGPSDEKLKLKSSVNSGNSSSIWGAEDGVEKLNEKLKLCGEDPEKSTSSRTALPDQNIEENKSQSQEHQQFTSYLWESCSCSNRRRLSCVRLSYSHSKTCKR